MGAHEREHVARAQDLARHGNDHAVFPACDGEHRGSSETADVELRQGLAGGGAVFIEPAGEPARQDPS